MKTDRERMVYWRSVALIALVGLAFVLALGGRVFLKVRQLEAAEPEADKAFQATQKALERGLQCEVELLTQRSFDRGARAMGSLVVAADAPAAPGCACKSCLMNLHGFVGVDGDESLGCCWEPSAWVANVDAVLAANGGKVPSDWPIAACSLPPALRP